jgi:hypothetical protein
MAGSLQPRVKTWVSSEDVVYSDLNAEFDNVLLAMQPLFMDDYSSNAAQMRVQTDAGEVGTESLATTLAGEIARLRFEIKEIKGGEVDYWYEATSTSLSDLRQLVGGGTLSTRVSSGRTTGFSSRLAALIPDGTNDGLKIDGSPTSFIYYVGDVQYTINSDSVVIDSLVKAPAANNTCLVNDSNAASGDETRYLGMYGTIISVDAMGANISSLIGKTAGFKIVQSGNTEYFTAFVESATKLRLAQRGGFVDSTGTAIDQIVFTDNAVITLMKLTWIFVTSSQTILVTYNEPVYAALAPSSPSTGDFWYDMTLKTWKRFDGTTFAVSPVAFAGTCMQDATNCVAARSVDSYASQDDLNSVNLEWSNNAEIRVKNYGAQITVFGSQLRFEGFRPTWNMATDLEPGLVETSSTTYYLYFKETGAPVISDRAPHERLGDLRGYYHPNETWRYVGKVFNNASSNLTASSLVAISRTSEQKFFSNDFEEVGTIKAQGSVNVAPGWAVAEGASVSRFLYNELYESGYSPIGNNFGTANSYVFNLPTTQGIFLRGRNNASGNDPDAASRIVVAAGGATGDNVGSYQADTFASHTHGIESINGYAGTGGTNVLGAGAPNVGPISTNAAGGNETRPKNVYVQYVIKVLA